MKLPLPDEFRDLEQELLGIHISRLIIRIIGFLTNQTVEKASLQFNIETKNLALTISPGHPNHDIEPVLFMAGLRCVQRSCWRKRSFEVSGGIGETIPIAIDQLSDMILRM